jgi:Cu/Ag efflux protein CusF
MTKQTTKWIIMTAACGALTIGAGAPSFAAETGTQPAQGSMPGAAPAGSAAQLTHATAMVTGIDRSARTLTLKKEDGETVTISVPADVKAYDRVKVGDRIDIDYYESLAVSMLPPGAKPSMSERTRRTTTAGGATTAKETTISAQVMSVDPGANKVTFKGPRGKLTTVTVQDPAMQEKLPSLKPGQMVQFVYTEATAASIRPAAGQ